MAFQNNALPFEISFFPTSVGANTLLNGGINKFKYYSLCDRYAYYPSNETNYVPSLVGSAAFDGFYQSVIPNELFNGSINQVPVSIGTNTKDTLSLVGDGVLSTKKVSSGFVNYGYALIDYSLINKSGTTNSFLGTLNGFGFPLTSSVADKWNFTPDQGGYKDSAVSGMSNNDYLLLSVNKDFCSIANGNTVKIEIPVNYGSGDTLVQMYGTQTNTGENLSSYDLRDWDASPEILTLFNNNKAVLLFSPQIDSSIDGVSWDTNYSSSNLSPYTSQSKPLATYYNPSSTTYSRSNAVGAYFVGSNIAVIWEPSFVSGFDSATGKTSRNITLENKVFKNYFSFNALITVNKFYNSINNSFTPNYQVRLDTMLVWDDANNLLGVGVFNKPLLHGPGDQFISQINLYV
jgi:hypothetical protein